MGKVLLLFSGGQDSTTCLFYALRQYAEVFTVGFSYAQRHAVELSARKKILEAVRASFPSLAGHLKGDTVIDLPSFDGWRNNALTGEVEIRTGALPTTFVPGRNLLFLCYAAALAFSEDIETLMCGVSEVDYSGYPDCREETITSMQESLSLGLARPVRIETPLMHVSKAGTWEWLEKLGGQTAVELVRTETHTCYRGERSLLHEYGYGCDRCPACVLRRKGWEEYQEYRRRTLSVAKQS